MRILVAVFFCFVISLPGQAQELGPLTNIARLKDAVSKRAASYSREGAYIDAVPLKSGQTMTLMESDRPGSITHIWMTINSPSRDHLRELVLRMYWDGESDPSVESPLGDFFGTGFAQYHSWHSVPLAVQDKALTCYFPMPFSSHAKITLTNDGERDVTYLFYQIDYEEYPDATRIQNLGRFHALWRRENPTRAVPAEESKRINVTGKDNYLFVDTTGRGQFVGVVLNVQGFSSGWWGEGDDMFFVDGEKFPPAVHGTGLEDYFGSAWGFREEFNYPFSGYSRKGNDDGTGLHTMYRFHLQDPVYFKKSLHASIEHGHANSHSDDFSSVAYWYQSEPHKPFPPLLAVQKRMPNRYWKVEILQEELPD
jgi:hypothetical protein